MDSGLTRLGQELQSLDRTSFPDDDARVQFLQVAQALCRRLESPYDYVSRITVQEVSPQPCLNFVTLSCSGGEILVHVFLGLAADQIVAH